ncbi:EAL domain-containing protein [Blastococcus haudaquaticus]|uniref:EAL domain-containing protein n=1 Tax=Blastococcus haudaquaticus TaxID=1938745 RepID=UPI001F24A75E|nr:EAL domain-containing protein [Blastococcus haudaquaticus]
MGAEALSRFPAEWGLAPDVVFAQAHSVGSGHILELLALERAAEHLDRVEHYAALNATQAPLRAAGLRLAIDDVGAGFSSLRHIVVTAPDVIRIDRSIVAGLDAGPVLETLVRSLVEFGHGCAVRVVAEGVEGEGEGAVLGRLGVDHGEGWHYGRPARRRPGPDHPAAGPGAAPAPRGRSRPRISARALTPGAAPAPS